MTRVLPFLLFAAPAFAGDDALFQTPTEVLLPTVIEVGEGVPLFLTDRGWTDAELRQFVFDGPAQVPLDGSALFLATALVSLVALRIWRLQA